MIFYLATDPETAKRTLFTRKDEAAKVDPAYKTLEIEPNKENVQKALQELLDMADTAQLLVEDLKSRIGSTTPVTVPKPPIPMPPAEKDAVYPEKKKKTEEIIDWIFDDAAVHQVAEILSALGSRLAETAAKAAGRSL